MQEPVTHCFAQEDKHRRRGIMVASSQHNAPVTSADRDTPRSNHPGAPLSRDDLPM
jgi:hypothetical protein